MTEPTHAAVVGVRKPDDPHSIAWSAALCSLDLLAKVKIPHDYKLAVETVSIVEPVATSSPLDFFTAVLDPIDSRRKQQVVVVTARLVPGVQAADVVAPGPGEPS